MPAGVTQIKGLPAVWGPIGGAERVPAAGLEWLSWRGRLEEFARRVVSDPMRRVLGRRSAQRAALVIAQNPEAASAVAQTKRPVLVHPNVVLDDPGPANPSGWLGGDDAPHALFVARLHAWKGVHLALAVLQHPDLTKWHLDVIGTGPERRRFLAAVDRLGMADRVHVHGAQSRSEVRGAMAKAEVLLYPSLRDAASWVVGEAQQMGCPIACVATGGPAVLLEAGGGIAVAPTGDLVASLSAAVLSARQLPRTSVSWLSEDLSTVLTRWYELALQAVPAI
jgi:glycosyltransferase involved in cell wall biosynthesis